MGPSRPRPREKRPEELPRRPRKGRSTSTQDEEKDEEEGRFLSWVGLRNFFLSPGLEDAASERKVRKCNTASTSFCIALVFRANNLLDEIGSWRSISACSFGKSVRAITLSRLSNSELAKGQTKAFAALSDDSIMAPHNAPIDGRLRQEWRTTNAISELKLL